MPGMRIGLKNSTKAMPNPRGAIPKNTVPMIKPNTNDLIITLVIYGLPIHLIFLLFHLTGYYPTLGSTGASERAFPAPA